MVGLNWPGSNWCRCDGAGFGAGCNPKSGPATGDDFAGGGAGEGSLDLTGLPSLRLLLPFSFL